MQKFPDLSQSPYQNLALKSRPDLSLEEEAKACGVAEGDVLSAWQGLERAQNLNDFDAACDRYIKLASMPLAEAALELGKAPAKYAELARYNLTPAFKYRERWRLWRGDFQAMLPSMKVEFDWELERS